VQAFVQQSVNRGCAIVPVLLPDANTADLPAYLQGLNWGDFAVTEPDPIDQLVWGITGRPLHRRRDSSVESPSRTTCGRGPIQVSRLRLRPVEVDERDPDIGVHHLAQLRGGLADDDLQRREHPPLEEMTAARCPV